MKKHKRPANPPGACHSHKTKFQTAIPRIRHPRAASARSPIAVKAPGETNFCAGHKNLQKHAEK